MCRQKIPGISGLVKRTDYNAQITKKKGKILSISGLATGADLTAVVNKVPDVSNLVIKTDYNVKILDINSKYFTTADYNKFLSQTIDVKLKQKGLVDKSAIAGFINNADLDKKK